MAVTGQGGRAGHLPAHPAGRTAGALYRPEYFPLPRFPLGISDVARAARSTLLGTVRLADMQLGVTLEDLIRQVSEERTSRGIAARDAVPA